MSHEAEMEPRGQSSRTRTGRQEPEQLYETLDALRQAVETQGRGLRKLRRRVRGVDRKVPPIRGTVATCLAIIAALGVGAYSIRDISGSVEKTVRNQIKASTSRLAAAAENAEEIVDSLKTHTQELVDELKGIQEASSTTADKLQPVSVALAEMMTRVQRIQTALDETAIPKRDAGPGAEHLDPLDLVSRALGSDAAPSIRLLAQARRALAEQDYPKARALARQAKTADPTDETGMYDFLIGKSLEEEGKYDQALESYRRVRQRDPENGAVLNAIGNVYWRQAEGAPDGQAKQDLLKKAAEVLKEAVQKGQSPVARVNLSIVLNALGDHDSALKVLEDHAGGETPGLLRQRAATYSLRGEGEKAVAVLRDINDPETALRVAADPDFEALHDDPRFMSYLQEKLGDELFAVVRKVWGVDEDAADAAH